MNFLNDPLTKEYQLILENQGSNIISPERKAFLDRFAKGRWKINNKGEVVVGGSFYCYGNQLTSLEGCPSEVGGSFSCDNNQLTSLEGCPSKVGRDFSCSYNQLTSLEGCPSKVGGSFWCYNNQLKDISDLFILVGKVKGTVYSDFGIFTQEELKELKALKDKHDIMNPKDSDSLSFHDL